MRKVFVLLALGVVGCDGGGDVPESREDAILALSADLAAGEVGYTDNCSVCHAADGSGGVGPSLIGSGAGESVDAMLNPPSGMTDFSDKTDQEIADIAGYVETL